MKTQTIRTRYSTDWAFSTSACYCNLVLKSNNQEGSKTRNKNNLYAFVPNKKPTKRAPDRGIWQQMLKQVMRDMMKPRWWFLCTSIMCGWPIRFFTFQSFHSWRIIKIRGFVYGFGGFCQMELVYSRGGNACGDVLRIRWKADVTREWEGKRGKTQYPFILMTLFS